MRAIVLGFVLSLAASSVSAQEGEPPVPAVRTRVERPPEGSMRRGRWGVPSWAVYLGGGLVVASAAGVLARRMLRARKR